MKTKHLFRPSDVLRILRAALSETDEPEELLKTVAAMKKEVARIELQAVRTCVEYGSTMAGVAESMGITKQAVQKRLGYLWDTQKQL